jgi:hypothetical protein
MTHVVHPVAMRNATATVDIRLPEDNFNINKIHEVGLLTKYDGPKSMNGNRSIPKCRTIVTEQEHCCLCGAEGTVLNLAPACPFELHYSGDTLYEV